MKHWHETGDVLDFLARVLGAGQRAALATVVRVRGSAYRHEGAKLAVAENGTTAGNVSGGCLEQDVREVALQVIRTGRAELRSYCSSADEIEAWDLGVGCEGQVRSEEHTSELQSLAYLVCRLLLEKKKKGDAKRIQGEQRLSITNLSGLTVKRASQSSSIQAD